MKRSYIKRTMYTMQEKLDLINEFKETEFIYSRILLIKTSPYHAF